MARRGRPTAVIELSDTERETLERWVRRHSSSQALALRSRIMLPDAAAVFAVDEKPQIQALDRTAPTLPMLATTPQRVTPDYQRNWTVDLFAALDIARGTVISDIRSQPQLERLHRLLEQDQPRGPKMIWTALIGDEPLHPQDPQGPAMAAATPAVPPELHSHLRVVDEPRPAVVLRPDHQEAAAGGASSAKELAADIEAWVDTWNESPTPFVWHKTAEQILERLANYCAALNEATTR